MNCPGSKDLLAASGFVSSVDIPPPLRLTGRAAALNYTIGYGDSGICRVVRASGAEASPVSTSEVSNGGAESTPPGIVSEGNLRRSDQGRKNPRRAIRKTCESITKTDFHSYEYLKRQTVSTPNNPPCQAVTTCVSTASHSRPASGTSTSS